ncbi:hypothetical protein [Candidatus Neptunichlamydia sp. REUL1]|uniref:hypothetical protein n=1 Tax=Candidatus Neptunichlamydia sp. REUL1 TaxID=3064277 RepID=UPI00292DDC62|nr:hypothetical protein [Candidatus Neptunochlamydia sp. REUL1]
MLASISLKAAVPEKSSAHMSGTLKTIRTFLGGLIRRTRNIKVDSQRVNLEKKSLSFPTQYSKKLSENK